MPRVRVFRQLLPFSEVYYQASTRLSVILSKEGVRIRLPGGKTALVSNELAAKALQGRIDLCPYTGKPPATEHYSKEPFRLHGGRLGKNTPTTVITCSICELEEWDYGDPELARARGKDPAKGFLHPERTFVTPKYGHGFEDSIVWEEGIPDEDSSVWGERPTPGRPGRFGVPAASLAHERYIVWVKGRHLQKNDAERAARRKFPRADVVANEEHFLVLRETYK